MAMTTRDWVDFFEKAGIPSNEAATYALIFTQNRIQKNMLSDLNKEYLKDMGISLLGDVIAILKHAKHVHENNVRIGLLETSVVSLESSEEDTLNPAGGTTVKDLMEFYDKKYKQAEKCLKVVMKSMPGDKAPVISKEKKLEIKKEPKDISGTESTESMQFVPKSIPKVKVKEPIVKRIEDVNSTTLEANTSKKALSVFSRLGDLSSLPDEEVKSLESIPKVIRKSNLGELYSGVQVKKKDPKLRETDFLKANALTPLKITTQFSDEDDEDAEETVPQPTRRPKTPVKVSCDLSSVTVKKRPANFAPDDDRIKVAQEPPSKKVRFGVTSTKVIDDSKNSTKQPVFVNHSIVTKITETRKSYQTGRIQHPVIREPIDERRPKLGSKMVADSIKPRIQSSIKARVGPKIKPGKKNSILERLG